MILKPKVTVFISVQTAFLGKYLITVHNTAMSMSKPSPIWLQQCVFHPMTSFQNKGSVIISHLVINPYRDGRSSEGQAQQHQQGNDLMVGVDIGQAQAAVMAVEARLHRLKYIRPLQEVQADHRRHQDWQLSMDTTRETKVRGDIRVINSGGRRKFDRLPMNT